MQALQKTYEDNIQENFIEAEKVEHTEEELTNEIYEAGSAIGDQDIENPSLDSETDKNGPAQDTETSEEEQVSETDVSPEAELEALRSEVQTLKEKIERTKRLEAELLDFTEVFPEQDISAIPDEVWQDVRKGNSLAAAFALFERKKANVQARATEINQTNSYRSSGRAGSDTANEFFSPDEVRAMSQSEVRANYSKIIESMKKWN